MTYEESATLMRDIAFNGRVKVAALKFASYILIEAINTPAHQTRLRWANGCVQGPESTAGQLQPPTVMDPQIQLDGAAVTDDALQLAVENVVNKLL